MQSTRALREWRSSPVRILNLGCGHRAVSHPHVINVDWSIFKDFVVSERWRLQYRAEFFNLFNSPQFDLPNPSIGSPAAGRITATIGPNRQIQMGLRLSF